MGRKSPLGGHGWISSPERRETATSGHSPIPDERPLNTETGHSEAIWRSAGTDPFADIQETRCSQPPLVRISLSGIDQPNWYSGTAGGDRCLLVGEETE